MDRCMITTKGKAMTRLLIAIPILLAAGCGGSPDVGVSTGGGGGSGDGLGGAVSLATAPYLVLDLSTGGLSGLVHPSVAAPEYRSGKMLFRRVSGQGSDYFMGVLEVTQDQWIRLAGASSTPWTHLTPAPTWLAAATGADKPAFNLSYDAVTAALVAFNAGHGCKLGIPTDVQWTFACAAGSTSTWSWGGTASTPSVLATKAVVRESQLGVIGPRSVGGTTANAFGLFDMHGNVWEWTMPTGLGIHIRGGSWADPVWAARTANHAGSDDDADMASDVAHALVGVRLTITP